MFGMLKGLVGSKSLTLEDMESVLEKMRDHLIGTISHVVMQQLGAALPATDPSPLSSLSEECSSRHCRPAL